MVPSDTKGSSHEPAEGPRSHRDHKGKRARGSPATWKDPKTGLEWQWQGPGEMTWHDALEYAQYLLLDGKNDWRVPTVAELETLLDRSILYDSLRPIMREEVPFWDTLPYWSSTTFAPDTHSAWIVMFDGGYVLSYYKTNVYHVRCVRGQGNAAGKNNGSNPQ